MLRSRSGSDYRSACQSPCATGIGGGTSGALTKRGTGTLTLSGANTYTGVTTASGGVLKLGNANALPGGTAGSGTSNLTINSGGVVGLTAASGNLTRGYGSTASTFQITGAGGGFAAYGGDRTVTPGSLAIGSTPVTNIVGTLVLSAADADSTLIWSSNISFGGSLRPVQVNNGSAAVDGRFSGVLSGGTSSGIDKTGAGTLEFTNASNSYSGATTVSQGTLRLGASDVLPNTTNVTIAAATLDVGAGFTDSTGTGTLDVSAAATINLGNSSSKLAFANSSAVDWTGGTLNITGTFVPGDLGSLRFGTSNTGLTAGQLLQITASGWTGFGLDTNGYLTATSTGSNTFASWIAGFSVGGQTGVNGDFDNDGLGNAVENLLGSNPSVFNQGLTAVSSTGGNLVFRHTLSTTPASDLTGAYEWSVNLSNWNATGATSGGTTVTFATPVIITPGSPSLVEVTATVTGTPSIRIFARFKATQP